MAIDGQKLRLAAVVRGLWRLGAIDLFLSLLTFLPAGIGWRRGWIFLIVCTVLSLISIAYLWRKNPEIFVARSKFHPGTKGWDKALLVPLIGSFFAIFAVAGFDERYAWSSVPPMVVVAGYAFFLIGFALSIWVYAVNQFAEPSVRIQSDRGQKVVDTGPYAVVRHPLYSASLLLIAGMSLALGSYSALIPAAVGLVVLVVRIVLEERLLRDELAGYDDYTRRVRYRLIPGMW